MLRISRFFVRAGHRWRRFRRPTFAARRAAHLRLGRHGEAITCRLLGELGADVLVRNYRHRRGEIDIVARDGQTLCFVEVKTRRRPRLQRPAAAVSARQKRRIRRAAQVYLHAIGNPDIACRFDIAEIILGRVGLTEVRYRRGAFG